MKLFKREQEQITEEEKQLLDELRKQNAKDTDEFPLENKDLNQEFAEKLGDFIQKNTDNMSPEQIISALRWVCDELLLQLIMSRINEK